MTATQILNALPVVQKMAGFKLPVRKAYKIYSLAKKINEYRDFFINEEKKLIDKFNAEILDNGNIKLNSPEDQMKFMEEHASLMETNVEDVEIIELSFAEMGDIEITPAEIEALEGVVNFID